ncbi:MAG: nucleotidyl transferase AbiEii/AbiGii toxin family protein [Chitinivibrionales bacterium]|nr:nucleotidyl transferase AbiEii/AbiGii toxin family protein [Chitinivibrionales bacterium]
MTVKKVMNMAASLRQKLLNKSKAENRSFEELVRRYAMERFLYRLSRSEYRQRMILKGAMMFAAWKNSLFRPTLDIDMLCRMSNDATVLEKCIREICSLEIEHDGIVFDPSTVKSETITKDVGYVGSRVRFIGKMENMRIAMQIDLGFGDVVFPEPEMITIPSFFEMHTAQILGYTRESAIAEKFHAMVRMAELNSRMKDFYDIWILSTVFDYSGQRIYEAIKATFERRDSQITNDIVAFTDAFARDKQDQWQAFRKKIKAMESPESFREVTRQVEKFLRPVISSLVLNVQDFGDWKAPDHWEQYA